MSDNDRKVGLRSEFDASGIKSGVQEAKDALKSIPAAAKDAAAGASAPIEDLGNKAGAAAKKLERDTSSMISKIQRLTVEATSGGKDTVAYIESIGRMRGIAPDRLAPYLAQLKEARAAQDAAAKSIDQYGMSAKATAAALRQVPAQFTDIVTSLASGQNPLTVILQQGGQLKDTFGGIGNAARALGTYVVGLVNPFSATAAAVGAFVIAAYQGAQELPALQKQLILSGDAAGYTTSRLLAARDAVAEISGATKGRAAEVLAEIAGSAGIGADNLQRFTAAAIQFERAGGDAADKTAEAFKALAKDPLAAALKLNETTNFLTRSTYQQIAALVEQGRGTEAARVAQEAYFEALNQRIPRLEENLGLLQRAWRAATDGAKGFWDAALNIGREDSLDQKLKKAQENLAFWQGLTGTPAAGPAFNPLAGMLGGQTDAARGRVRDLQEQSRLEAKKAEDAAKEQKATEATAKWREITNRHLSDARLLELELERVQQAGVAAGKEQVVINEELLKIKQKYDTGVSLDRIGEAENARSEQIKRALIEINELRARGSLSEIEALERSAALEQQNFASQRRALQERLEYVKGRQNSEKEASAIQAQLAAVSTAAATANFAAQQKVVTVLELRKKAARDAYEAERLLGQTETDDYLRRQVDSRNRLKIAQLANAQALREESDLLMMQAGMVGASEAARARALEFYRIELDLKRQIQEIDEADLPNGEADREELRARARADAAQRRANAQRKAFIDESNRQIDTIADGLTDALMRGFENGAGFAKNFRDTLKNMFSTLVLRPIIEPIFRSAAGSLLSAIGGGGSGSAGGLLGGTGVLGNLASLFGAAGNFFGSGTLTAFGSGLGSYGTSAAAGAQYAAGSSGYGTAFNAGSSLAAFGPWAALIAAGMGLAGNAYDKGFNQNNLPWTKTWLQTGGLAPISLKFDTNLLEKLGVSGRTANIITGASLWSSVFGRAAPKVYESGISGSIGAGDLTGQAYADWKAKGGLFRSDKWGSSFQAIDKDIEAVLDQSAKGILTQTEAWAKALGLPAEVLAGVTTTFKTKLTGNAEEDQKAIDALMATYQGALTGSFKTALEPFKKAGEELTDTFKRLVGLQQFSDTINSLGGIFSKVARASVDAREGLLSLVGGADEFIRLATGFVGNYYSRDEIAGGKAADIQQQLKNLGLNMDFSATDAKSQFRALVEGTDVSTADGQKRLATLLGLQGDFASVADYLSETGKSLSEVAGQAPNFDVLAPLLANGTTQQVQATNEVTKAVERLTEVVQQGGGAGSSSGFVKTWREVGLAVAR